MTKDKTVTMSRDKLRQEFEAANSDRAWFVQGGTPESDTPEGFVYGDFTTDMCWTCYFEARRLAAPVVERQDGSALMKIAADLANRHPLRQLYLVCEHQGRINTDSLHEYLDKCGDLLAGIALDIRRAINSPPAPVAVNAQMAAILQSLRTNANPALFAPGQLAEVDACLDKVKELSQ